MNHATSLAIVGMLAALIGTIAINIPAAYADKDVSKTTFKFENIEKNNCSGFAVCTNAGAEEDAGGSGATTTTGNSAPEGSSLIVLPH
jgi:hypothetical protein